MLRYLNRKTTPVLAITITIVSFLLFHDFGESDYRVVNALVSLGHLPLFGAVALVVLWVLKQNDHTNNSALYFKAWIITSMSGIVTECIQALLPYRHFRFRDIYTDALGAVVFLVLAYSFQNKSIPRYLKILRNILLLLVLMRVSYIFILMIDTWDMGRTFPVLSSYECPFEMSRYSDRDKTINRARLHATNGEYSLRADLKPGLYPGISMNYLHNDWRGYSTLSFDVYLEGSTPLNLTVRINDRRHNNEYTDRFNKEFQIFPESNHISIKLDEVKTAPHGRVMDMADMTNICIFAYNLKVSRTLYFDNFRLGK